MSKTKTASSFRSPTDLAWIGVLFLVALALRLWNIGAQSIWVDEGASVDFATAPAAVFWGKILLGEQFPYYILLRGWTHLFGISDLAIRLPTAIVSAAAVIPMYLLVLEVWGRRMAIAAVLLLAFSAMQVAYAQEARVYAFLSFLFLCSLLFAGRVARNHVRGTRLNAALAGFVLTAAALTYCHITGLLIAGAVFVFFGVVLFGSAGFGSATYRLFLRACLVYLIAIIPIFGIVAYSLSLPNVTGWLQRPSLYDVYATYHMAWGQTLFLNSSVANLHPIYPRMLDLVFALPCAMGAFHAFRSRDWTLLGLIAALASVVVAFPLVSFLKPILVLRVLVFATPIVLVVAAYGLRGLTIRWAFPLALLATGLTGLPNLIAYYTLYKKEQWRALVETVASNYGPHDVVIYIGSGKTMHFLGGGPVMVRKYWPSPGPGAQILITDDPSPWDGFTLAAYPQVVQLAPDTPCPLLGGFEGLHLTSRSEVPILDAFRNSLREHGSEMTSRTKLGRLVYERWSRPICE